MERIYSFASPFSIYPSSYSVITPPYVTPLLHLLFVAISCIFVLNSLSGGSCTISFEINFTTLFRTRNVLQQAKGHDLFSSFLSAVEFFQQISMLYGTLAEFCTDASCPIMSAGPRYEYYWADGQTVKKPVKCSAPRYINNLMMWTQNQLENESIFPSKIGKCHSFVLGS